MTDQEYSIAATEVLEILKHFKKEDVNKISKKFISFLETKKILDYNPQFDYSKPITELNLRASSKALLGMIYRKYWCSPEEKERYDKLLKENSEKYQKILREKYNPDNIFKKG